MSSDVLGLSVFRTTRMPAGALLDYLVAGNNLDAFFDDTPSFGVSRRSRSWSLSGELMPS